MRRRKAPATPLAEPSPVHPARRVVPILAVWVVSLAAFGGAAWKLGASAGSSNALLKARASMFDNGVEAPSIERRSNTLVVRGTVQNGPARMQAIAAIRRVFPKIALRDELLVREPDLPSPLSDPLDPIIGP